ncbi:MAG: efflux RND transporter periplasmic adaptor subunit [Desulfovibrio sp.]|jgi:membrane fusion protein (multidrug efflux system)|nr:efflux RND transporter periplasmic adaptor subunit [Desulfovibrio sp.]
MDRQLVITFVLLLCFSFAACGGDKKNEQQGMPTMPVSAHTVVAEDIPWPTEYQAQTIGSRAVEVRARVEALIEKRLYNEGDFVKEGQLLFQLERDQYEARMQQAEAQYDSAEREWKRIKPLYEKNAVSQKDRDNARAAYESAKAELRQAKINLDWCQVTAPVSGYSSKENFTPGNLVNGNSLLTYINQTDPIYIDFSIAAPDHMRRQNLAKDGRLLFPPENRYKAKIRLLDGGIYDGEGYITFIDSQVQASTGVIKARAVFANADGRIMPGQYVRLYMEGDVLRNAVLIPQKCVMLTQQGAQVMALDKDNKVSAVPVTLSVPIGDKYLVDSGLKGGERIISEGLVKARPGAVVRVPDNNPQQNAARK